MYYVFLLLEFELCSYAWEIKSHNHSPQPALSNTHFTILCWMSCASCSTKRLFHILGYQQKVLSFTLSFQYRLIDSAGFTTLSIWPWMIKVGHLVASLSFLSGSSSIKFISCLRLPEQILPLQTWGSLARYEAALVFLVAMSNLISNIPVLFGINFSATSDTIDTSLLVGFLIEGAAKIIPENLMSFIYLATVIAIKPPKEWPIRKMGTLGQSLATDLMNEKESLSTSLESSKQPLYPSDLPCPLWSNPTKVIPLSANVLAQAPANPVCRAIEWKKITTALVEDASQRQVARAIFFLSWMPTSSMKLRSGMAGILGTGASSCLVALIISCCLSLPSLTKAEQSAWGSMCKIFVNQYSCQKKRSDMYHFKAFFKPIFFTSSPTIFRISALVRSLLSRSSASFRFISFESSCIGAYLILSCSFYGAGDLQTDSWSSGLHIFISSSCLLLTYGLLSSSAFISDDWLIGGTDIFWGQILSVKTSLAG